MWIPAPWSFIPTWTRSFRSSTCLFSKRQTTSLSMCLCISICSYSITIITGMLWVVPSATPRFFFTGISTPTMATTYFQFQQPTMEFTWFGLALLVLLFRGLHNFNIALVRAHGSELGTFQWALLYKPSYTAWDGSFWSRESWIHFEGRAGQASTRPHRVSRQILASIFAWQRSSLNMSQILLFKFSASPQC